MLVTNYGDFSDGTTVINCTYDFGALVKVDRGTKARRRFCRGTRPSGATCSATRSG